MWPPTQQPRQDSLQLSWYCSAGEEWHASESLRSPDLATWEQPDRQPSPCTVARLTGVTALLTSGHAGVAFRGSGELGQRRSSWSKLSFAGYDALDAGPPGKASQRLHLCSTRAPHSAITLQATSGMSDGAPRACQLHLVLLLRSTSCRIMTSCSATAACYLQATQQPMNPPPQSPQHPAANDVKPLPSTLPAGEQQAGQTPPQLCRVTLSHATPQEPAHQQARQPFMSHPSSQQQPFQSAQGPAQQLPQHVPDQPAHVSRAEAEDAGTQGRSSATPTLFQPQPQYYIPGQGARLAASYMPAYSGALPGTGLASPVPYPPYGGSPAAAYAQAYGIPGEHNDMPGPTNLVDACLYAGLMHLRKVQIWLCRLLAGSACSLQSFFPICLRGLAGSSETASLTVGKWTCHWPTPTRMPEPWDQHGLSMAQLYKACKAGWHAGYPGTSAPSSPQPIARPKAIHLTADMRPPSPVLAQHFPLPQQPFNMPSNGPVNGPGMSLDPAAAAVPPRSPVNSPDKVPAGGQGVAFSIFPRTPMQVRSGWLCICLHTGRCME